VILANNHPSGISEPSHAGKVMRVQIKKGLGIVDMRTLAHFTSEVSPRCPSLNGGYFDRRELRPPFCCDLCGILHGSMFPTLWNTDCMRYLLLLYLIILNLCTIDVHPQNPYR